MARCTFAAVWEFSVKPAFKEQFEEVYGPDGDWAILFNKSPGYLGTSLLSSVESQAIYVTIDRWISREAFAHFKQAHQDEYKALDQKCEGFTESERSLGSFQEIVTKEKANG